MKFPLVEVGWVDSTLLGQRWQCNDEAREMGLNNCRAVGYILKKDKTKIVLAQSMCAEDDSAVNLLAIPRGCIKSIRVIKD